MTKSSTPLRIIFVCLGNICRSPLAEGLFGQAVLQAGLSGSYRIDSAGTGNYHQGELADPRTRANATANGLELTHRARQFEIADFDAFDHILVMDKQNEQRVLALARGPEDEAKVMLMRTYDPQPEDGEVPDPYFGGEDGFEHVYQVLKRSAAGLLTHMYRK